MTYRKLAGLAVTVAACLHPSANAALIALTEKVGADEILVYDDPCPGDSSGQLRWLVRRTASTLLEGCWLKNNRGNLVVKWLNSGLIQELDGNSFKKAGEPAVVLQEMKPPSQQPQAPIANKPSFQVADAVFLTGSSKAFDVLSNRGQSGLKQDIRACYAKLSFNSQPSAVASCFSFDLTAAWIDEGMSKAMGAPPDTELLETQAFERGANGLRVIGVETEPEVAKVLRAWKEKVGPAFRKAAARGTLQLQQGPEPKSKR